MFVEELPKESTIVIIGCGVVGCAIARELSRYDVDVVALEQELDVGLWVSRGNMGVVHPFIPHKGKWKTWMCLEGNRRFDELSRELDFPFRRPGLLIVAFSRLTSIALRFVYIYLKRIKKIKCEWVSRKRLFQLEPNINPKARSAILVPSAGVTDPALHTIALAENAAKNGVKIVLGAKVVGIMREKERFIIETTKGRIKAQYVINSSGLSSDIIESLVGIKKRKMWHGKGAMIVFDEKKANMYSHIIAPLPLRVDPKTKGGAMILDPHGRAVWGPNLTLAQDKFDDSVLQSDVEAIIRKFGDIIKEFPRDAITYYYAGVRPVDETSWDFVLGPTEVKNFINAAYILSPGLTASTIIAEKIVEYLRELGLELKEKKNFDPTRKGITRLIKNIDDADQLIARNEDYAKALCPDSMITEAEVKEAIRRGAKTIDSILIRLGLDREPNIDPEAIIRIIELLMEEGVSEIFQNKLGSNIFMGD